MRCSGGWSWLAATAVGRRPAAALSPGKRTRCQQCCCGGRDGSGGRRTGTGMRWGRGRQQQARWLSAVADGLAAESPRRLPKGAVVLSGIQPTGVPHIGNYLGALQRWVQLQDEAAGSDTQLYFCVVDLHALTRVAGPDGGRPGPGPSPGPGDVLRQRRREMLAALLAVGLDPERCVLFYQSAVPAHSELMWLLSCTASVGYLSRMTQWKSKLQLRDDASVLDDDDGGGRGGGSSGNNTSSKPGPGSGSGPGGSTAALKLGLFSYPVLQAADVLVHRATHVPVGDDQAQHLEFARECATNFNHTYGRQLVAPTTLLSPARRIMSLQQPSLKMSKSHSDPRSRVLLTDPPDAIRAKIMAARTDSTNAVSYDPVGRPGVANLLELLVLTEGGGDFSSTGTVTSTSSSLFKDGIAAAAAVRAASPDLAGQPLRVLKDRLAAAVTHQLAGVRERFVDVLERDGGGYLDRVAEHGAAKARANAEETMHAVRTAVGLR